MAVITSFQEGDDEVTAPSAAKAISRGDEDVLAAVLERTGGPLPFLQAAIDVARECSGLFRDPTAARKVAAMAKAARAQVEAEEKLAAAKEEARKLTERRRNDESRRAADAGNAEKDGRRIREPNAENGLDLEKYSWTQELSEVNITVPLPQGTKPMFVVCEIEKNHLKVALKCQTPIIDGVLYRPVDVCNCIWTIGREITVYTTVKAKQEVCDQRWPSVIRGGPEIDIKKVKIMPSRVCDLDTDDETRQALQKLVFERHQRNM